MTHASRQLRERLISLLQSEILEDKEIAERLEISVKQLHALQDKIGELETARQFLEELSVPFSDLQTLKEYVGIDRDPQTKKDLDHLCPDVVAIIQGKPVGIELTAYAPDEADDRLSSLLQRISDINRTEIASAHSELSGFTVFCSPNEKNIVLGRDVRRLVEQIADFVKAEHCDRPFTAGEDREIPTRYDRLSRPFEKWSLIEQHVTSLTFHYRPSESRLPFSIPVSSFTRAFGTSLDHVLKQLEGKIKAREKAYCSGLSEVWLLIHAIGQPRSSRLTPLAKHEIDRILASSVRQAAINVGYDRVYLWDGVHGGYVNLVDGAHKCHS
jgi:hypothetical protein